MSDRCVNIDDKDFKVLQKEVNINPYILATKVKLWQGISKSEFKKLLSTKQKNVYNNAVNAEKKAKEKRAAAAKKRAETKKQKEIEKAKKVLENAGLDLQLKEKNNDQ